MTMRGKFTAPGTSIHYYVVEFDPTKLSRDPHGQNAPARSPVGPLAAPSGGPPARLGLRSGRVHAGKRLRRRSGACPKSPM